MRTQLHCPGDARRAAVRDEPSVNGIDYLEVLASQRTLLVYCFRELEGLDADNVVIEGGQRVVGVEVEWATAADELDLAVLRPDERARVPASGRERILVVRTDRAGDFSTYRLELVESSARRDQPPEGFDPIRSGVDFSFKVDCESEFDCAEDERCDEPELPRPQIDYLAKDYGSFRRLLFDRLSVVMPDWRERNPSDVLVALVELVAYVGDQLSYHQDAAATEAYIGTARRRASVRRHARLVDYRVHDGANARAWVTFEIDPAASLTPLGAGTPILTGELGAPRTLAVRDVPAAVSRGALVFETLEPIVLREPRNAIEFHTWSDPDCCLPAGATRATLRGNADALALRAGDVLLFEEVRGARTGRSEDRDRGHCHAVRLVSDGVVVDDPLEDEHDVIEIAWHRDDALPFPLCLRQWGDDPTAVARGNVVLCDHGTRVSGERLALPREGRRFRPLLERPGLTHAAPYDVDSARRERRPAREATRVDIDAVKPWAFLRGEGELWEAERELLGSDRFATKFVVEMAEDGRAQLRFGDEVLGREPQPGSTFTATYRVGNGRRGNVGPEALKRVAVDGALNDANLRGVRNPMAAVGGTDPEPLEQARLYAPQAFRSQKRAVTAEDYARAAERHPEVQRAGATRRWTGSWWTIFVTVDRLGGLPVDREFEAGLRRFLDPLRMAGHDLEIDSPRFVALELALEVCVRSGYVRSNVHEALLEELSNRRLPNGRVGFFHPDELTFGQTVYLSRIVARAMRVPGVEWVEITKFQRFREAAGDALDKGRLEFGRLEIPRLDNDPNRPENGRIQISTSGGL